MPPDRIQVAVAVVEQKLMARPLNFPLEQIYEVAAVYFPSDKRAGINSESPLWHTQLLITVSDETLVLTLIPPSTLARVLWSDPASCSPWAQRNTQASPASLCVFRMRPRFQALLVLTDVWKERCVTAARPHLSTGTEAPLRWTTVGNRSMLLVGSSTSLPPGMLPGHRRIPGTRIPPSQFVDFPAARGGETKTQESRHFFSSSNRTLAHVRSRSSAASVAKGTARFLGLVSCRHERA